MDDLRPGERIKLYKFMLDLSLNDMALAVGEGRELSEQHRRKNLTVAKSSPDAVESWVRKRHHRHKVCIDPICTCAAS